MDTVKTHQMISIHMSQQYRRLTFFIAWLMENHLAHLNGIFWELRLAS